MIFDIASFLLGVVAAVAVIVALASIPSRPATMGGVSVERTLREHTRCIVDVERREIELRERVEALESATESNRGD